MSKPQAEAVADGVDLGRLEAFYDERYEGEYMSGLPGLEVRRTRDALNGVELPAGGSIVDYGCGRGVWTDVLLEAFPGASITGIEISSTAVAAARQAQPGHEFLAFDGRRAPLADGSCDLVFSHHVLEHVLDLDATVGDMVRLVRTGGFVCAILPCANRGSIDALATRLTTNGTHPSATGESRFFYEDPGHLRRLTSEQLIGAFAECGCEFVTGLYSRNLAAIAYICSWPALVLRMFDPARARSRPAAAGLALLRMTLLPLAALLKARSLGLRRLADRLRNAPDSQSRLACLGAILALPLAQPVGRLIEETLPAWEWRRSSRDPGSAVAQFLVFRKR